MIFYELRASHQQRTLKKKIYKYMNKNCVSRSNRRLGFGRRFGFYCLECLAYQQQYGTVELPFALYIQQHARNQIENEICILKAHSKCLSIYYPHSLSSSSSNLWCGRTKMKKKFIKKKKKRKKMRRILQQSEDSRVCK